MTMRMLASKPKSTVGSATTGGHYFANHFHVAACPMIGGIAFCGSGLLFGRDLCLRVVGPTVPLMSVRFGMHVLARWAGVKKSEVDMFVDSHSWASEGQRLCPDALLDMCTDETVVVDVLDKEDRGGMSCHLRDAHPV